MKTTKQKLVDTVGWGFILWALGFLLGMMLFAFVPAERLGWFILPVMLVVTIWVAMRRLHGSGEPIGYFILVGGVWLAVALIFDYVFLVKAFAVQNYYDADILLYYVLTLLIPVAVGFTGLRPAK